MPGSQPPVTPDDPTTVGWLISYWRQVPCSSGCEDGGGTWILESRQFDHLIKAATRKEALERFEGYVENKRASGKLAGRKGMTLFLSKVDTCTPISDDDGEII